jgi:hypothetical protein
VSRGPTVLVRPTAVLSGIPTRLVSGRINYYASSEKITTHGEGSNLLPCTKEIAVRDTQEPERRPGIFGWDPRYMGNAPFV